MNGGRMVKRVRIWWDGLTEPTTFEFGVPIEWDWNQETGFVRTSWTFGVEGQRHHINLDKVRHIEVTYA